jgi:signal transduction histidine kinase
MSDTIANQPVARDYARLVTRMERIIAVSQTLAATLDQDRLLRLVIEAARDLVGAEASSILLLDPLSSELHFEASTGPEPNELDGVAVPLEGSVAGWIVSHREPLLVPDTSREPRWNKSVDDLIAFASRTIVGVPLIAHGETLGALEAINKVSGEFDSDDVGTLQWLAALAAVAIVNARLFQQSDVVTEMVHELRTPLSALMAVGHLLLRPEITDEKRLELVGVLQRETGRLAQLTTDFLDMARLESGRVRFAYHRLNLDDLLNECVGLVEPQAAEYGVNLVVDLPPDLPVIETDHDLLKQVLLNLLTNALKYNHRGGQVRVTAAGLPGHLRVRVSDTGVGIPPASVARLFEKYYRAPGSEGRTGTGLGLPIAKRIIQALDGKIDLESTGPNGSTFYFDLPARPRQPPPANP